MTHRTYQIFIYFVAAGQEAEEEVDPIEALGKTIPGLPGDDYPIFAFPPETSFLCDGRIEVVYLIF